MLDKHYLLAPLLVLTLFKENVRHLRYTWQNDLPIHRTKLEKADTLYAEHKGELLAPPTAEFIEQLPPLVRHEFSIKEAKTDVVFSGLGWITVQHANVVVAAYAPKGVQVSIRPSLI